MIEEQLVRIAHPALDRVPRSVDPVAVVLPGVNTWHIAVPDVAVDLGEGDPRFIPGRIEQAEIDPLGDLREEGEIVPCPSHVAPSGYGVPGQILIRPPGPNQTLSG